MANVFTLDTASAFLVRVEDAAARIASVVVELANLLGRAFFGRYLDFWVIYKCYRHMYVAQLSVIVSWCCWLERVLNGSKTVELSVPFLLSSSDLATGFPLDFPFTFHVLSFPIISASCPLPFLSIAASFRHCFISPGFPFTPPSFPFQSPIVSFQFPSFLFHFSLIPCQFHLMFLHFPSDTPSNDFRGINFTKDKSGVLSLNKYYRS